MTVTLSIWLLPIAATVAIWLAACFWPGDTNNGPYGFGRAFDFLMRAVVSIVATLLVWLFFFFFMWVTA